MLHYSQVLASVAPISVGQRVAMTQGGKAAHRHSPAKHPYFGKRLSDGSLIKAADGLDGLGVEIGDACSDTEQTSRRDRHGVTPNRLRTVGNPPAAAWAMLVISRAMSS